MKMAKTSSSKSSQRMSVQHRNHTLPLTFDISVPKSTTRAATEIKALQCLTEQECKHAPKHLGNFSKTIKTPDGTVGCVVRYVLMTQLPGYALGDGLIRSSLLTRHGVERAFDEAIK